MQNKIAMLGFRGVGKSTVSKLLAQMKSIPLYAMDSEIEKKEGRSISHIVDQNGWNYFRDLELRHITSQMNCEKVIMDCGGGVLEGHDGEFSAEKNDLLKNNFYCIYLFLPDDKLLMRLRKMQKKSSRPALQGDLHIILEKRKPWFEQIAHAKINTDGLSAQETADKVAKLITEQTERVKC